MHKFDRNVTTGPLELFVVDEPSTNM